MDTFIPSNSHLKSVYITRRNGIGGAAGYAGYAEAYPHVK